MTSHLANLRNRKNQASSDAVDGFGINYKKKIANNNRMYL